ncbi:MAG TPA: branched-chain amino acid ABC transporter permease [Burkholderiales bacterium]|nr:branched-chain amino acid ABC transporter permease [Burkholderiales bacterium]
MIYAQVLVDGVIVGLIVALVAMGLSLIYGVMNIVNFAHGEFMMIAMYLCFFLSAGFGLDPLVSAPIVAAAMFAFGVLVYRLVARHLLEASMVAQMFATFGMLLFSQALVNFLWKADTRSIPDNWSTGNFSVAGLFFSAPELVAALGALATAIALFWFINRTETGLALQAAAEDPQVARLLGVNTDRMYALAWALSAATVGVAGALLSTHLPVYPLVGANWALPAFVAVAIGGFGSITGAFWGGIIVGLVQTVGGFFASPSYKLLFVYGLYLLLVLVRPHGLLGKR